MSKLEICVIDTDTGLLYEWNGSSTVNVFVIDNYMFDHQTKCVDMWTMAKVNPSAEDFIASVKEHVDESRADTV